jgi:protocatechuate 3,4-dioxygenase beta subunit
MDRRKILKSLAILGAGAVLPRSAGADSATEGAAAAKKSADCWITPRETEGPFYFDDPKFMRRDITEGRPGARLDLEIAVVDKTCKTVPGVMVDIWHCDKDGVYSGYNQPHANTVGETFLRGTQKTDGQGVARFTTIYPGWYMGRATHIHFKARLPDRTYVTSQFAFPDKMNDAVYATAQYSEHGANPVSNADDGIFDEEEPAFLMVDVVPSGKGYTGKFTIGVDTEVSEQPRRRRSRSS